MTAALRKFPILSEMNDEMLGVFSRYLTTRRFEKGFAHLRGKDAAENRSSLSSRDPYH